MARTRIVHKKKVYNPNNNEIWIEVERLDKLIVETGKGIAYQKTVYTFAWDNEQDDGTWDGSADRTTIKHITNPNDPSQFVDLPVIDRVIVETGRGIKYQKTVYRFDNTDANAARQTHNKTVHGSDGTSTLDVEVIDKIIHESGRGIAYQKTVTTYEDQGDEAGSGG